MPNPYIVLSRKYRPKVLSDLIGQEVLAKALKSCIDNAKIPHAFLFHGIQGVGKTTTARILSRCLSCLGKDGLTNTTSHPCGECRSCLAIDRDQHMDIMEFDAASRTGVDDIREIIDSSQYAPVFGRYKIYIIDEVHMLSKSAFNALLKNLEEPPQHVKFIFATTEIHKIPETILSRCMIFQLKPVSHNSLAEYLNLISGREGYILEKGASEVIAEEAGGSVRDSLSILEQTMMLSSDDKRITAEIVISILGGATNQEIEGVLHSILSANTKEALSKTEELLAGGADPCVIYKGIQNCLYKMITESVRGEGTSQAHHSIQNLLYIWQILLKQMENIQNAIYPDHVLNATVVILSITASFKQIGDLVIKDQSPSNKVMDKIINKFDNIQITEIE